MSNKNSGVIFDMDGVIVQNAVYHYRAWEVFCRRYKLEVSFETVKSWFGNTNPMILKNLFGENLDAETIEKRAAEKEAIYREIYLPEIKAAPGLKGFLELLASNNYTTAIATSAPTENVDFVLEKTGLGDFFHHIIDASMIEEGKPSPEIYLKTAEVLKLEADRCVVFEDSYHGIQSARSAGMRVIGVATTHPASCITGTERNIKDFTEISIADLRKIFNSPRP